MASSATSRELRPRRESSTTVGIIALVASLWVGTAFWGALDTAFCRIYELPCRSWVRQKLFGLTMMAVVVLFIAATIGVPALATVLSEGLGGFSSKCERTNFRLKCAAAGSEPPATAELKDNHLTITR